MIRELVTRFGRENIGFLWIMVEPLLFAGLVGIVWRFMKGPEEHGVSIVAFIATGGPKPNFIGVNHLGDNLFANCLIALDARTGRRLWHFQEIPHDLWDRDISAPPNLATITRDGKRVARTKPAMVAGWEMDCVHVGSEREGRSVDGERAGAGSKAIKQGGLR